MTDRDAQQEESSYLESISNEYRGAIQPVRRYILMEKRPFYLEYGKKPGDDILAQWGSSALVEYIGKGAEDFITSYFEGMNYSDTLWETSNDITALGNITSISKTKLLLYLIENPENPLFFKPEHYRFIESILAQEIIRTHLQRTFLEFDIDIQAVSAPHNIDRSVTLIQEGKRSKGGDIIIATLKDLDYLEKLGQKYGKNVYLYNTLLYPLLIIDIKTGKNFLTSRSYGFNETLETAVVPLLMEKLKFNIQGSQVTTNKYLKLCKAAIVMGKYEPFLGMSKEEKDNLTLDIINSLILVCHRYKERYGQKRDFLSDIAMQKINDFLMIMNN